MKIDDLFRSDERKIRKLYESKLLSELLYLNYEFDNKKYHNEVTGKTIYASLHDSFNFTEEEKQEIVNDAILLLKVNHKVKLLDFENLIFEKEK